jgi:hypothetical protein
MQIKNSPTRNLHRLAAAILFIKLLFERLLSARAAAEAAAAAGKPAAGDAGGITLREAAIYAYEASLAPIHTAIVKVRSFEQGCCHCCHTPRDSSAALSEVESTAQVTGT